MSPRHPLRLLAIATILVVPLSGSAEEPPPDAAVPSLVPPRPLELELAPWPEGHEAPSTNVGLVLTLDEAGNVVDAEVSEPAGEPFDELAREASLRFRFEPAQKAGVAVAARIRFRHPFIPPKPSIDAKPLSEDESEPEPERGRSSLAAVDRGDEGELTVLVRGKSNADRRRESAEAVVVLDTAQAKSRSLDLGEVLARQEGVEVRRAGGLGSGTSFSLNGLSDQQVRFFLDGVPLDLAGFPYGIANVPVHLLEGVEIYRGVVPIRFGADALGGAVNLVSDRHPRGSRAVASLQAGAFGTWRLAAAGHHREQESGFLTSAHLFHDRSDNDYRIGVEAADPETGKISSAQVDRFHDAYRATGGGVEVGFVDVPWADRLSIRLQASTFDKELQNPLVMTPASVPFGEARWSASAGGAQLSFERSFTAQLRLDAIAGYGRQRTRLLDDADKVYGWFGPTGATRTGGELAERKRDEIISQDGSYGRFNLEWRFVEDQALRVGVSPTLLRRVGEDRLLPAGDAADALASVRTQLAIVSGLEYELDLFDDRLETILFVKDYRYRSQGARAVIRGGLEQVEQSLTRTGWGTAARLRLGAWSQLKASFELATRFPSGDELFGDGGLVETNLQLGPETSRNVNLGVETRDLPTPVGKVRGGLNGFARVINGFILLQQTGLQSAIFRNVGEGTAAGVEAAAGWSSPGKLLHLDGNLTWQDFRNTSKEGSFAAFRGDRMVYRPWLFANASLRIDVEDSFLLRDRLSPFWTARYVHEFFLGWESIGDPATKSRIPSQLVHTVGLSYRVPLGAALGGITFELDNLTDEKTFDFFGVQRPGRAAYIVTTLEY